MAVRYQLIKRPPTDVWMVLSDGARYADWVVGTYKSRPVDSDWPTLGSKIEYLVRLGPWRMSGYTVVRRHEPPGRLELEAFTGRLGTTRIAIEINPWGADTLVVVDEHPLSGPAGTLHNAALDALIQLRHRSMLRRLADVVEGLPQRTRRAHA